MELSGLSLHLALYMSWILQQWDLPAIPPSWLYSFGVYTFIFVYSSSFKYSPHTINRNSSGIVGAPHDGNIICVVCLQLIYQFYHNSPLTWAALTGEPTMALENAPLCVWPVYSRELGCESPGVQALSILYLWHAYGSSRRQVPFSGRAEDGDKPPLWRGPACSPGLWHCSCVVLLWELRELAAI